MGPCAAWVQNNKKKETQMKATNLAETMSMKDIEAVESALKSLRKKMPFLIRLSPQERLVVPNPGEQRLGRMQRALEVVTQNGELLPKTFDLERFRQDVAVTQAFSRCLTQLMQLASDVRDTLRTVATEPLKATNEVYAHVRAVSTREPSVEALARHLSGPAGRAPRATATAEPQAPPSPPPPPSAPAAPPTPAEKAA